MDIFPIASEARQSSRDVSLIFNEIRDIEQLILQAISENKFALDVTNTTMTSRDNANIEIAKTYYKAWKDSLEQYDQSLGDPVLKDQMCQIIKYFKEKQYTIYRKTNVGFESEWRYTFVNATEEPNILFIDNDELSLDEEILILGYLSVTEKFNITADSDTNIVSWTMGSATRTNGSETETHDFTDGSDTWLSGIMYVFYDWDLNEIKTTSDFDDTQDQNKAVLAIYRGDGDLQVGSNQFPIDNNTMKWVINW